MERKERVMLLNLLIKMNSNRMLIEGVQRRMLIEGVKDQIKAASAVQKELLESHESAVLVRSRFGVAGEGFELEEAG